MSYNQKYNFINKLTFFQPAINACITNFSSVGARKHGPYTYETDYEQNYGRIEDSLESLIRHYTQMMTLECIDKDSGIPHLYNMATRSLMLLVRYYRDHLNLGPNERKFHEPLLKTFLNQKHLNINKSSKREFLNAQWLPPELYISIMKCPNKYIEAINNTLWEDIIDMVKSIMRPNNTIKDNSKDEVTNIFDPRKNLEIINSILYTLTVRLANTKSIYPKTLDIYNDLTLVDWLFYEISLLIYCFDKGYPIPWCISHYNEKHMLQDENLINKFASKYNMSIKTFNYSE